MKFKYKLLGIIILTLAFTPQTEAANKRCGLGSKIFGGSSGLLSQISEIGTNGLFSGYQSISNGTSGCDHNGMMLGEPVGMNEEAFKEQDLYANANFEELIVDMSVGKGETLEGFGRTLGCGREMLPAFFQMTQREFQNIYTSEKTSPTELLLNTRKRIQNHSKLSLGCATAA